MHQQSNCAIGNPFNKILSANTFLYLKTQSVGVISSSGTYQHLLTVYKVEEVYYLF